MIERIERSVIYPGRRRGPTWFHPRVCVVPGAGGPTLLMTCQTIGGSDYFGPVHWAVSVDAGATWSEPEPIPALGRIDLPDGKQEGVCDVVPEHHAPTDTVLAIGQSVYYRDGALTQPDTERRPVYAVRDAAGRWSARRYLHWDDARATALYMCGCSQRVTLDDGRVLLPMTFGPLDRADRAVGSVVCEYDGRELLAAASGNDLRLAVKRGLLEPSLVRYDGRFLMTIRAEDDRGYVSVSDDGLHWADPTPWCWDDGEPLVMSTTQQHWLAHSDGLHLVYTRRSELNANVVRWRSPLYVARVDVDRLRLVRETEQVVLPLIGDAANDPTGVALMGNFHPTHISPTESLVTVGENVRGSDWKGDTLQARIIWSRPNRLVS